MPKLESLGIDFGLDPIPVRPAAHYLVGGVQLTGLGGARTTEWQYLDSTLLEKPHEQAFMGRIDWHRTASGGCGYAERCANHVQNYVSNSTDFLEIPVWRADGLSRLVEHAPLGTDLSALRNTMTRDVGLVKSNSRLSRARRRIDHLRVEFEKIWSSASQLGSLWS